ncbi:class I SAM-dependent methyltransferase [Verrucomicrobium sp. BvORR106]|uniref:class I SAM-dependent methyltransferase n=1 Tax=Verrucomicrobium sp. BvORR106 TaxID=1403819 RepID=UPI00068EB4FA|nr:class I SAM-dependent methyltransferase [Verrucomicrobium sp. BvORR106]
MSPLAYTGERMIPGAVDTATFWEHVERYRFAVPFAEGKNVADIACGEGYGTAALARSGALSVVGIDVASTTVAHAQLKYGVDARIGSAEAVPLADCSLDLIVSFETIEHLQHPERFLEECGRLLRANGQLIISTPNPNVYQKGCQENPFHCSEMEPGEFKARLRSIFRNVQWFGQRCRFPRWTRLRAGTRLYTLGRRIFNPLHHLDVAHISNDVTVALCQSRPTFLGRHFTPESVRSIPATAPLEGWKYLIAVASN